MSVHSSRGTAWQALRKQVLQRDNYICTYCNAEATEVDHVIPKAAGGKDDMNNLVSSCKRCNASKQAKMFERTNWYNRKWFTG